MGLGFLNEAARDGFENVAKMLVGGPVQVMQGKHGGMGPGQSGLYFREVMRPYLASGMPSGQPLTTRDYYIVCIHGVCPMRG